MDAREFADKEIAKIQRHLAGLFKAAQKDISAEVGAYGQTIKAKADKLLQAIREAQTETERKAAKTAYNHFYLVEIKRDKQFRTMTGKVVERLNEANKEAAAYINTKTAQVYTRNYNEVGKELQAGLQGYDFKPVSVAEAQEYGQITAQTINKQKDEAWNKRNIISSVVGGALLLTGAEKVFSRVAKTITGRNLDAANRYASDTITDAESKGRLDSMYRANDEGFEVQKQWVCVFDNRTRDTHRLYNDLGPVELDYEYDSNLLRPRDPSCPIMEEVCNCRCAIKMVIPGLARKGTRSARKGEVAGSYKEPRSFAGTESVNISNMTYEEWMKWRS